MIEGLEAEETAAGASRQLLSDGGPPESGFISFERGVLQDNIILCDAKSGVLLAFSGAMVLLCIDTFIGLHRAGDWAHRLACGVALAAGGAFLVSCHFALATVIPRFHRSRDDLIFWESSIFKLSADEYVGRMKAITVMRQEDDMLHHLHLLARICRTKFLQFGRAIRLAQLGFALLVLAELGRMIS